MKKLFSYFCLTLLFNAYAMQFSGNQVDTEFAKQTAGIAKIFRQFNCDSRQPGLPTHCIALKELRAQYNSFNKNNFQDFTLSLQRLCYETVGQAKHEKICNFWKKMETSKNFKKEDVQKFCIANYRGYPGFETAFNYQAKISEFLRGTLFRWKITQLDAVCFNNNPACQIAEELRKLEIDKERDIFNK